MGNFCIISIFLSNDDRLQTLENLANISKNLVCVAPFQLDFFVVVAQSALAFTQDLTWVTLYNLSRNNQKAQIKFHSQHLASVIVVSAH